jgi:ABC-type Fe3+ transport system, permease component
MQNLKIWKYLSLPWLVFALTFFVIFFFLAFFNEVDIKFLSKDYLASLFLNTILISFSSAIISALIAVPLAILVTFYKFPGSNFFSWALSLSIAFPAYVYAFIFVGIFEYSSPISEYLRIYGISLPSIKNIFGASIIMSMALFPYIFLITKAQLSSVGVKVF